MEADFFVALVRHPDEAVALEFHAVGVALDITLDLLGQKLDQFWTVEEHTHLGVQPARAGVEIVGADETNVAVEGKGLCMQARTARAARSGKAGRTPSTFAAGGRFGFVEFDAGFYQWLAVALVSGMNWKPIRGCQRIGDHHHADTALPYGCQRRDALLSWNEIRRDEEEFVLCGIDDLAKLGGKIAAMHFSTLTAEGDAK